MICNGNDILRLAESNPFAGQSTDRGIIQFVSVLSKRRIAASAIPLNLPSTGEWGLKVLSHQNRFVLGVYRRQMKAISYLGRLEKIFGVSVTTRNWNTILAIARILKNPKGS